MVQRKKNRLFILLLFFFISVAFPSQGAIRNLIVDSVGAKRSFFVEKDYDRNQRTEADFIFKKTSERAYWYVDASFWSALSYQRQQEFEFALERISKEFDTNIYPTLTSYWGDVWNPGIDGDPRVTIALGNLRENAAGYYNYGDEVTRSQNARSNEREIIYVNANFFDHSRIFEFVAHEFQHLITYNQKERRLNKEEEVWINEMRSEYAGAVLGYQNTFRGSGLEKRAQEFFQYQSEPLLEWSNQYSDYSAVAIFGEYLRGRFGTNFHKEVMRADAIGVESIEKALRVYGNSESFESLFMDWTIANLYNDASINDAYTYHNENLKSLRLSPTLSVLLRGMSATTLKDNFKEWTSNYYNFTGQASGEYFKMSFSFPPNELLRVASVVQDNVGNKTITTRDFSNGSGIVSVAGFGRSVASVTLIPVFITHRTGYSESQPAKEIVMYASVGATTTPVVYSADTNSLSIEGGQQVSLQGDGFMQGLKMFINKKAAEIKYVDASRIVFVVPKGDVAGNIVLEIINSDGGSYTNSSLLRYKEISEGSLIRAIGDYKVYIVNRGGYRRHILNPKVFELYQHFKWSDIMDVDSSIVTSYKESSLMRVDGSSRVYQTGPDLIKHWINMKADAFTSSGRTWESIFIINKEEGALYREGSQITQ